MSECHTVSMLIYPDVQILDVTGPLEVFARTARWLTVGSRTIIHYLSITDGKRTCASLDIYAT